MCNCHAAIKSSKNIDFKCEFPSSLITSKGEVCQKKNLISPPFAPSPKPLENLILSLGAAGISNQTLEVDKLRLNLSVWWYTIKEQWCFGSAGLGSLWWSMFRRLWGYSRSLLLSLNCLGSASYPPLTPHTAFLTITCGPLNGTHGGLFRAKAFDHWSQLPFWHSSSRKLSSLLLWVSCLCLSSFDWALPWSLVCLPFPAPPEGLSWDCGLGPSYLAFCFREDTFALTVSPLRCSDF